MRTTNAESPGEPLVSVSGTGAKEPLQVRIPRDVKRCFKAHAAMLGLEPNELFVEMWQHYERSGRK